MDLSLWNDKYTSQRLQIPLTNMSINTMVRKLSFEHKFEIILLHYIENWVREHSLMMSHNWGGKGSPTFVTLVIKV